MSSLDDLLAFTDPGDRYPYRHGEPGAPARPYFHGGTSSQMARIRMGATRLGISEEAYIEHTERGELWCTRHREWHPADLFAPHPRRASGKQATCRRPAGPEAPA